MSRSEIVRRRAGERPPEIAFDSLPRYQQGAILAWIELSIVPASGVQRDCTSYGLKHDCEDEVGFYVGNDGFKGAMLKAGYEPDRGSELNWQFRIKRRHRRRTGGHSGFALDRERLDPIEVSLFDTISAWARLNQAFDEGYRPMIRDEDRQAFRGAGRLGLVGGGRIDQRMYAAITGDCHPPRPRRSVWA